MNGTDHGYELGLKPLKLRFLIVATLFIALAASVAIHERSRRVLEKTGSELTRAKSGLAQVKEASMNRRVALANIKSQIFMDSGSGSPEGLIYGKVDEIKARLKPDDMTITALEKKEGNVSLTYTLKFINTNYCEMLNAVSHLQQDVFPFAPVNTIALAPAEQNGKGVVEFTIIGSVLTPDRSKP
jgi:hypothetical protein